MTDRNLAKDILVSVVIPSYNAEKSIAATLASVSAQKCTFSFEVIVVDSSADSTPQIITKQFPQTTLIHRQEKTPAAVARNLGSRSATGQHLAFLDADCVVGENWLTTLVNIFSDTYCAIGGPVLNGNPESTASWAGYIVEFSDFFPKENPRAVDHLPSCNLFMSRETFDASGGFPEKKEYFPQEDRLFTWLLRKKTGKQLLFQPDNSVQHHHRSETGSFLNHQKSIGRAGALFLRLTDGPGSELARNRMLINLLLPIIPFKKLFRCIFRALRLYPAILVTKPLVIPLITMGQIYWMYGFGKGVNTHLDKLDWEQKAT